jgi:oxygen-independent coproporphyrinogen-3 oxidase
LVVSEVTKGVPILSPRAAYVHVPFCRHRCGYCNFSVVAGRDDLTEAFLEALARELSELGTPREVDTLFIGGGTPTHLESPSLVRLLEIVKYWFPTASGYEWTVEANPIDLSQETAEILAAYGVTRISLGVQSFQDRKLALLERDHRSREVRHAFDTARHHISSVSIDLIFGVPGETLVEWTRDLSEAIALGPDHLSTYSLTFERGTQFWNRRQKGNLLPIEEDAGGQLYERAIDTLGAAGWQHYEVSSFARPGYRCRHNEVYWTGGEYFAAGPGAARFINGRRESNHRSTSTYLRYLSEGRNPVQESELLDNEMLARERLVFGLRRLEGIALTRFQQDTGYTVEQLAGESVRRFLDMQLLEETETHLRLTRRGLLVSDSLWPDLI